nr:hypothetical protein [Tanacetum cinerariifolium]
MDPVQELASPEANGFCDSPLLRVHTPRCNEDRLKLMELMVFLLQKDMLLRVLNKSLILSMEATFTMLLQLQVLVDKKKIVISEVVIREILQLDDTEGIVCLPNEEIFTGLAQMGYEKPMAMASAVICLSKGQKFNFSKYIFDSLVRNVDSSSKFYMYPQFIQLIIQNQVGDLSTHSTRYISLVLTQKVFANMRRVGKGFSGVETPLFASMLVAREVAEEGFVEEQVQPDGAVAAAIQENVVENVAEDFADEAIPSSPSHDIPSPSQEQTTPPQQPHISPPAPPQEAGDYQAKGKAKERIESSDDMEVVFNQGRMINEDEGIELVKDADIAKIEGRHADEQAEKQAEIYNLDLDHPSKVLISVASATIPASKPSIPAAAPTVVVAYTRRRKGVIIRDPEEESSSKTLAETPGLKDKGKGILVEKRYPLSKFTLEQLVNATRLQVEEESKMSLELLRVKDQLGKGPPHCIYTPLQSKTDLAPFALVLHQDSMSPFSLRWTLQLDARADAQLFVGSTSDKRIDQAGSGVAGRSSSNGFYRPCLKFTVGIWALSMFSSSDDCACSSGVISSSISRSAGSLWMDFLVWWMMVEVVMVALRLIQKLQEPLKLRKDPLVEEEKASLARVPQSDHGSLTFQELQIARFRSGACIAQSIASVTTLLTAMLTYWGMFNCSSVYRRDPWLSNLSSMSLFTWIRSAMMCSNSPIRFTIIASVVLCYGACGGGNVVIVVVVVVSVVVALNC